MNRSLWIWCVASIAGTCSVVTAQWTDNLSTNTKVCQISGDQKSPQLAVDGSGGAIIVWQDGRSSSNRVYAQRLDSGGVARWTDNGVLISNADNSQLPQIVSDGVGGAIITWFDMRAGWPNGTVAVQRVNAAGDTLWKANGVILSSATNSWPYPRIAGDGAHGAIVTWLGPNAEVMAQKIDSAGHLLWPVGGVPIGNKGERPRIVGDGSGGAVVTWYQYDIDGRYTDIFAQRVNAAGTTLWKASGDTICYASGYQNYPELAPDGAGGAIIGWLDGRSDTASYIYAQRTSGFGWGKDGIKVSVTNASGGVGIASDKAGGAYLAWVSYDHPDIYIQRVSGSGALLWGGDVRLTTDATPNIPQAFSDGGGGVFVIWEAYGGGNIMVQHVRPNGTVSFATGGTAVCSGAYGRGWPSLTTNGTGKAIVAWEDLRPIYTTDIYAQRFGVPNFTTGIRTTEPLWATPATVELGRCYPNPFNPSTTIPFSVAHDARVRITVHDLLGRTVATLLDDMVAGGVAHTVRLDAAHLPSGTYWCRLQSGGATVSTRLMLVK